MQTNNPPHFVKHWKDWFYQKRKNAALQLQHSDLAGLFPVHAVLERRKRYLISFEFQKERR
jgi:hypothetical protein